MQQMEARKCKEWVSSSFDIGGKTTQASCILWVKRNHVIMMPRSLELQSFNVWFQVLRCHISWRRRFVRGFEEVSAILSRGMFQRLDVRSVCNMDDAFERRECGHSRHLLERMLSSCNTRRTEVNVCAYPSHTPVKCTQSSSTELECPERTSVLSRGKRGIAIASRALLRRWRPIQSMIHEICLTSPPSRIVIECSANPEDSFRVLLTKAP